MKLEPRDYLIGIMFFSFTIITVLLFFAIQKDSIKCSANALSYGVKELSKQVNEEVLCVCTGSHSGKRLIISSNDSYIPKENRIEYYEYVNRTKINLSLFLEPQLK